jgi:hypothetical protein
MTNMSLFVLYLIGKHILDVLQVKQVRLRGSPHESD